MKTPINSALIGLALLVPPTAAFAQETNHWRFDTSINLFMAGLSGDVTTRGVPAAVDLSFTDVAEDLEFAAAGRVTVGYDRWSLSTEFSYLGIGGSKRGVDLDLDQWLVEPSVGYQFCRDFELFAGVRYNNLRLDVTGPLGRNPSGTQDWWDPIVGANLRLPFAEKFSLNMHGDVGGFGVGSDLTWQAYPHLNWRFASWGSAQAGYRWLGTDYETGSGTSKFKYDVVLQGPQVGMTIHF